MTKKKIKMCFKVISQSNCTSSALLLIRLVAGSAFIIHGWGKMQSPMSWMGPQSPVPGFFQLLASISEFGGGLGWVLGLFVPLASVGITCTMGFAVLTHLFVMKDPFVNLTGGSSYELALNYFTIAILLLTAGPGVFSLDAKIFGQR